MNPLNCFKAYDIRGRLGIDLDEGIAYRIGAAFAVALNGPCCTNRVRDSLRESSMIAGGHEQLDTYEVQDHELVGLQ